MNGLPSYCQPLCRELKLGLLIPTLLFFFNLTAKVFILRGERDLTGLPNSFYLSGDVKVAQDRPVLHLTRAFTFK